MLADDTWNLICPYVVGRLHFALWGCMSLWSHNKPQNRDLVLILAGPRMETRIPGGSVSWLAGWIKMQVEEQKTPNLLPSFRPSAKFEVVVGGSSGAQPPPWVS